MGTSWGFSRVRIKSKEEKIEERAKIVKTEAKS